MQLDQVDDTKKALERIVVDEETAIANANDGIATSKDDIAALRRASKPWTRLNERRPNNAKRNMLSSHH